MKRIARALARSPLACPSSTTTTTTTLVVVERQDRLRGFLLLARPEPRRILAALFYDIREDLYNVRTRLKIPIDKRTPAFAAFAAVLSFTRSRAYILSRKEKKKKKIPILSYSRLNVLFHAPFNPSKAGEVLPSNGEEIASSKKLAKTTRCPSVAYRNTHTRAR